MDCRRDSTSTKGGIRVNKDAKREAVNGNQETHTELSQGGGHERKSPNP
jgi:hypothetical protein